MNTFKLDFTDLTFLGVPICPLVDAEEDVHWWNKDKTIAYLIFKAVKNEII